ncbi:glycosyltransferase [Nocardioides albidus]|uniref:Glycosyltransferase n=1 Tax=Nocardioides albidus TaxID=1517589 RepID=A0A5C4W3J3_9ACTN|nr:glycosyltransferase family 2 protein [Nocardioides albidus]TNM42768.1 glycosyltransferase [Nocardioides albidus]
MSSADGPSLEILVPFWGEPELLYATVDSVLAQTDTEWSLVVIDDAYPDPSVAAHFAALTDSRIRYQRNETNLGIAANFQRCLDLATADLMVFLGCDDLLEPEYVARARSAMAAHPQASMYQPGVQVVDEHGEPCLPLADRVKDWIRPNADGLTVLQGEALAASLLRGNWLYWPSLVFRTEHIRRYRFRQDLPIILDLAIILDQIVDGAALVVDPAVTFRYRRHTASLSGAGLLDGTRFTDDRRYFTEAAQIMRAHRWPRAARAARTRWTSRLHGLSLVPGALRNRDRAGARAALRHAFGR